MESCYSIIGNVTSHWIWPHCGFGDVNKLVFRTTSKIANQQKPLAESNVYANQINGAAKINICFLTENLLTP